VVLVGPVADTAVVQVYVDEVEVGPRPPLPREAQGSAGVGQYMGGPRLMLGHGGSVTFLTIAGPPGTEMVTMTGSSSILGVGVNTAPAPIPLVTLIFPIGMAVVTISVGVTVIVTVVIFVGYPISRDVI